MQSEQRQGESLVYLTVTPDDYDPEKAYPTVILLHGYGANMNDLAGLCPAIERERYIFVCPNAPIPVQIGPGKVGYAWTPPGSVGTSEDGERAEDMLNTLFDEIIEELPVDADRMVLGGFSQGGMMTYTLGLTNPGHFRGLVALSSRVNDEEDIRERLPVDRDQPILVAHGTADSMISIDDAKAHGPLSRGRRVSARIQRIRDGPRDKPGRAERYRALDQIAAGARIRRASQLNLREGHSRRKLTKTLTRVPW